MQFLQTLFVLPLLLFSLVSAHPITDGTRPHVVKRGQCFSGTGHRGAMDLTLPPIDVPLNDIVYLGHDNLERLDYNYGGVPDHRFRYRASGDRRFNARIEIEFYGYIGAHVELRAHAPATETEAEVEENPYANVNGGGDDGWGNTVCLETGNNFNGRRDFTFTIHISMGNMYPDPTV